METSPAESRRRRPVLSSRTAAERKPTRTARDRHRFVIVANRLPVHRVRRRGQDTWQTSPGGLVSAMEPVLHQRRGAWIGWSGATGHAPKPFGHEGIRIHPVGLTRAELDDFYHGFANRTLWPLYHDAVRWPEYHRTWWRAYCAVNRRYAEAAAAIAAPGSTVWLHDYHLQLVPAMLRRLCPGVRIGFFLHIPFPPLELFAQIPWRRDIVEGLLGSDLLGFQTEASTANFWRAARRYSAARGSRHEMHYEGRRVRSGTFPISIDVGAMEAAAASSEVIARVASFKQKLGNRRILLGSDRLDYTKGIDTRLKAVLELLSRGSISAEECVMVQCAVPSRERVLQYTQLKQTVEELVGRINGDFGTLGRVAVHYLHRSLPFESLVALYRAADVMLVTPYRDGMNLVAKEYVATRLDDTGALVLSEFTGAAQELTSALLVNPHDVDGMAATIQHALELSPSETRRRMRRMRSVLHRHDVFKWADTFLNALES